MKPIKPILLFEDHHYFNIHKESNAKYKDLQLEIQTGFFALESVLLPIHVITSKDCLSSLYATIDAKYKEKNGLGITADKLVGLLNIPIAPILNLIAKLEDFNEYTETKTISDFSIYAETNEQIERLNYCNSILKVLAEYKEVAKIQYDVRASRMLFGNVLQYNDISNPTINISFVLNGINFRAF